MSLSAGLVAATSLLCLTSVAWAHLELHGPRDRFWRHHATDKTLIFEGVDHFASIETCLNGMLTAEDQHAIATEVPARRVATKVSDDFRGGWVFFVGVEQAMAPSHVKAIQCLAECVRQAIPSMYESRKMHIEFGLEEDIGLGGNNPTHLAPLVGMFLPTVADAMQKTLEVAYQAAGWSDFVSEYNLTSDLQIQLPEPKDIGFRASEHLTYKDFKVDGLADHNDGTDTFYTMNYAFSGPEAYDGGYFYIKHGGLPPTKTLYYKPNKYDAMIFLGGLYDHGVTEITSGHREMFSSELWDYPDTPFGSNLWNNYAERMEEYVMLCDEEIRRGHQGPCTVDMSKLDNVPGDMRYRMNNNNPNEAQHYQHDDEDEDHVETYEWGQEYGHERVVEKKQPNSQQQQQHYHNHNLQDMEREKRLRKELERRFEKAAGIPVAEDEAELPPEKEEFGEADIEKEESQGENTPHKHDQTRTATKTTKPMPGLVPVRVRDQEGNEFDLSDFHLVKDQPNFMVRQEIAPGEVYSLWWRNFMSVNQAYVVGLPEQLIHTVRTYFFEESGLMQVAQKILYHDKRILPQKHRLYGMKDGQKWRATMLGEWFSDFVRLDPADQECMDYLAPVLLGRGQLGRVLEALQYKLNSPRLAVQSVDVGIVSKSQDSEVLDPENDEAALKLVIPIHIPKDNVAVLDVGETDERAIDGERWGMLHLNTTVGVVLGSESLSGPGDCDYRESGDLHMVLTIHIVLEREGAIEISSTA